MFIRDPDLDFLHTPDPGSRGRKGTGSRIRIRKTGFTVPVQNKNYIFFLAKTKRVFFVLDRALSTSRRFRLLRTWRNWVQSKPKRFLPWTGKGTVPRDFFIIILILIKQCPLPCWLPLVFYIFFLTRLDNQDIPVIVSECFLTVYHLYIFSTMYLETRAWIRSANL